MVTAVTSAYDVNADPTPTPEKPSLVDAANAAKKKRLQSSGSKKTTLVISDETLITDRNKRNAAANESVAVNPTAITSNVHEQTKMEMWRQRYREHRQLIGELEGKIVELDQGIPELWHQFYVCDDANQRERKIKPLLESALMKRRDAEERLIDENKKAAELLREARLDGALPGWFRDIK